MEFIDKKTESTFTIWHRHHQPPSSVNHMSCFHFCHLRDESFVCQLWQMCTLGRASSCVVFADDVWNKLEIYLWFFVFYFDFGIRIRIRIWAWILKETCYIHSISFSNCLRRTVAGYSVVRDLFHLNVNKAVLFFAFSLFIGIGHQCHQMTPIFNIYVLRLVCWFVDSMAFFSSSSSFIGHAIYHLQMESFSITVSKRMWKNWFNWIPLI